MVVVMAHTLGSTDGCCALGMVVSHLVPLMVVDLMARHLVPLMVVVMADALGSTDGCCDVHGTEPLMVP
jgi:hypothetical protein